MAGKQLHFALDRSAVSAFKTLGSTKISFDSLLSRHQHSLYFIGNIHDGKCKVQKVHASYWNISLLLVYMHTYISILT